MAMSLWVDGNGGGEEGEGRDGDLGDTALGLYKWQTLRSMRN